MCECIDTGWISSEGPFVKKFEEGMANTVGRKNGIAVSNGTAALEVACQAIGISKGDEVIMPAFTIISCAMAATKLGGLPVDMDPVLEIANKYGLKIIEDAAEMHGQTYKGKPCGSFGDISTFSFYPNKHITTGEGGMVQVDDEELAERCRMQRNLCFRKDVRYVHDEISENYRFTNLQAAVGLAQLERLDEQPVYRKMGLFVNESYPIAEMLSERGLYIPSGMALTTEKIYKVASIVDTLLGMEKVKNE